MKQTQEQKTLAILPTQIIQSLAIALDNQNSVRFLRLPHPRTGLLCLFLAYAAVGSNRTNVVEVQAVSPHNARSWFLNDEVVGDGTLKIMTPIDPAFLLLPLLQLTQAESKFRPADELLEEALSKLERQAEEDSTADASPQVERSKDYSQFVGLDCAQRALRRLCEEQVITSETVVYRYSQAKTIEYLRRKVVKLTTGSILEESRTVVRGLAMEGLLEDGNETMLQAGRQKAACELLSQYLPKSIYDALISSYDFTELNTHRQKIQAEADSLRAVTEAALPSKTKKGKAGEKTTADNKRKAQKGSNGVEKLKKANVNGMSKMTSFFKKKE